ncbi:MAG: SUMF1/EgtB/PvdO family nonheme iron enzyme [Anaerolineae bacterium]|nr:SUMF1/EgtB/PvdO family nonheme iron enzyme [Anaerolineae bacterium]
MSNETNSNLGSKLRRTFGWSWRESAGHMLLLNTFLEPRSVSAQSNLPGRATWEATLGEPVEKAVERFRVQGVLAEILPKNHLTLVLAEKTVAELTGLLEAHGLPVSGRKAELVERLVENVAPQLFHLLPGEPLLQCTPYGERAILEWLTDPKTAKQLSAKTIFGVAVAVLSWLLVEAIAPELIGSYIYDLLTQVHEPSARKINRSGQSSGKVRETYVTSALKLEWCYVPAGNFWMGSEANDPEAYDGEKPRHKVYLPAYYIAKYPITNQQYQIFVRAAGHRAPSHWENGRIPAGKDNHPVNYVSWSDAVAFCDWAARVSGVPIRLLTEAEWEKAARGPKGYKYPWGNDWQKNLCNAANEYEGTTPVTQFPRGASPYGVFDMSGNVWEWTSSTKQAYPYKADDGRERMNADDGHVLRGGSWYSDSRTARSAYRGHHSGYYWLLYGFRVGWSAPFSLASGR